jgi:Na+-driven multidrug efflux pump
MFIDICKYGLPTGIQNSVIGFANVLVQTNINSFGKEATAGCGVYSKIEGFAFLPVTSFSMALSTYVGQNLGAGKKDRVKKGANFGVLTSIMLAELIGIFIYVFAPQLIGIFSTGPKVLAIGVKQARTAALFYCLLSFSHCIAGICRGAGKAFVPMFVMLGIWCVLRITYITVAMKIKHEIGLLFMAYPITWFISSIIFIIYYKKANWMEGFSGKK